MAEAEVAEAEVAEAEVAEAEVAEAEVADAEVAEAEVADAEVADADAAVAIDSTATLLSKPPSLPVSKLKASAAALWTWSGRTPPNPLCARRACLP
ncbi:hypothetical protein [Azospirillum sp. B506]|uniref:hypothetical protein n=1 Tax=Azospirillum sp. B506 TaxID=137721 RepID=UPI000347A295|nr:hypothetical protein [Azospirillum sp. B506]